jgi:hypothetical protein
MLDAVRIAAIRHRLRQPPANAKSALGCAQQQKTAIGGLVATFEIDCEFLALDRWQIEGKHYIVGHAAVALGWYTLQFV